MDDQFLSIEQEYHDFQEASSRVEPEAKLAGGLVVIDRVRDEVVEGCGEDVVIADSMLTGGAVDPSH